MSPTRLLRYNGRRETAGSETQLGSIPQAGPRYQAGGSDSKSLQQL